MTQHHAVCIEITLLFDLGNIQETLSALIVNIKCHSLHNIPTEHPRASSMDDVECFTHKEVIIDDTGDAWLEKGMCGS